MQVASNNLLEVQYEKTGAPKHTVSAKDVGVQTSCHGISYSWTWMSQQLCINCPCECYLNSIHGAAVTPNSCLSISCSNFAHPNITMRLITSHMLSSALVSTTFPPPPDSVLENHWQTYGKLCVHRSCKCAGVSGVLLLGSSADLAWIVLWQQTARGPFWHIETCKDCCLEFSRCQCLKQKCNLYSPMPARI